jgi:hypothetical protein
LRQTGGSWPERLHDRWHLAAERAGGVNEHLVEIAGRELRLRFAGTALQRAILPAFGHLHVHAEIRAADATRAGGIQGGSRLGAKPVEVCLFDAESTGVTLPDVPWDPAEVAHSSELTVRLGPETWASADQRTERIVVSDQARGEAVFHIPDPAEVSWSDRAAPLRQVMHFLLEDSGLRMVHAAAVGRHGKGVLVVGRSGAGKTTLALACLNAGLDYLGDDYVAVETGGPSFRAHSIYATAKPSAASLELLPGLEADVLAATDPSNGAKAALGLAAAHAARLPSELEIRALVMPALESDPTTAGRIEPASGAEAMLAMAPSTIMQHPSRRGEGFGEVAALARGLPCFRLGVGRDLTSAVKAIEDLL